MTPTWVSVVALLGWLVLSVSALRARQLNARKAVVYALIWGAIFLAAAAVFTAIG
ncbi:MAG: hypothetical protein J2O44_00620 [Porphyrobacter sp.]|nr:hypothetical protein [Porphyrobacter sp.]